MRAFPLIRDLVTDVSWNYEVNKTIQPFTPPTDVPQEDWRWQQQDIERVQEYRKCIECFLCQDVCHVLRNHETEKPFMGPRFLVRTAGLEMHPIDQADRREYLKDSGGIGYCNITKCCTEVCPEHIKITDNAIIPLKERVADEYYDPIQWVWRKLRGGGSSEPAPAGVELPVAARRAPADGSTGRRSDDQRRGRLSDTALPGPRRARRRGPPPRAAGRAGSSSGPTARRAAIPGRPRSGAALFDLRAARRARRPGRARTPRSPTTSASRPTTSPSTPGSSGRSTWRASSGAREVHLLLDSKLIVEQLAGRWRVKDAKLIPLWTGGPRRPCAGFDRWSAAHVPRALNSVADALANEAIDRAQAGGPASVVRRPGG